MSIKFISINQQNIDKYIKEYKNLVHTRIGEDYQGDLLINIENNELIGILNCNIKKKSIQALEINPVYRRQGYATLLLHRAVRSYHCKELTVRRTNKNAIALYKKEGWKKKEELGIMDVMIHS